MPVSVSFLLATSLNTLLPADMGLQGEKVYAGDRFSYIYQVLVARKFNENFSFEVNPTLVHRNLVATALDPNDTYAVGFGGRIKLSKRVSFNGEWYHVFPPLHNYESVPTYDPIAFGFDIETGGHVFQLLFTNSLAMTEKGFITETTGRWSNSNIHFGFNISRVFALAKHKDFIH
jgi:hypothetical protein